MAGRPPKPTALKRLRGEVRASRLKKGEPEPPQLEAKAAPPVWLTRPAKRVWAVLAPVLVEMRVLTKADAIALGNLCELMAEFQRQCKDQRPSGKLAGEIRQHLGRFGLTPADRARITVPPAEEEDAFAGFDGLKVVKGGKAN